MRGDAVTRIPREVRRRLTLPPRNRGSKSHWMRRGIPPALMKKDQIASSIVEPVMSRSPYTHVLWVVRSTRRRVYLNPPREVPSPYPISIPMTSSAVLGRVRDLPLRPRWMLTGSPTDRMGSDTSTTLMPVPIASRTE
jgi:hypothetical protein